MNKNIYAPKGVPNGVCCKIPYKGYEISIATDDSCGAMECYGRSDIRVYREWDDKNVTSQFWHKDCDCWADADNLKYIFAQIDMFGDRD